MNAAARSTRSTRSAAWWEAIRHGRSAAVRQQQPLSIADEVTSALEINERVSQAIEVFKYKAGQGRDRRPPPRNCRRRLSAMNFIPALQGLPRDEKEKVGDFLAKLDVLKNQIEVRDFEQVDGQIADIQKIASDFDATKPHGAGQRHQAGKPAAPGQGPAAGPGRRADRGDAGIPDGGGGMAGQSRPANLGQSSSSSPRTRQNQSTGDFDRLVQDQNYREIFDRQLEFALAVKGDATREQQLKDALKKVAESRRWPRKRPTCW